MIPSAAAVYCNCSIVEAGSKSLLSWHVTRVWQLWHITQSVTTWQSNESPCYVTMLSRLWHRDGGHYWPDYAVRLSSPVTPVTGSKRAYFLPPLCPLPPITWAAQLRFARHPSVHRLKWAQGIKADKDSNLKLLSFRQPRSYQTKSNLLLLYLVKVCSTHTCFCMYSRESLKS